MDELGLTPEQRAVFDQLTAGFGCQDENGVDLSLLRANLALTPSERILKLEQAAQGLYELRRAREASVHPDR